MSSDLPAHERFWEIAQEGKLPVSVSVCNDDGEVGLATMSFSLQTAEACRMVFSNDHRMRATAAIHAVRDAGEALEQHYDDLHPQHY